MSFPVIPSSSFPGNLPIRINGLFMTTKLTVISKANEVHRYSDDEKEEGAAEQDDYLENSFHVG